MNLNYKLHRIEPGNYEGQLIVSGQALPFFVYRDGQAWCTEVHGRNDMMATYHGWSKAEVIAEAGRLGKELLKNQNNES